MAVQLFKLVVASTITDTQYFQAATADYTITTAATTINASNFFSGAGTGISTFATATTNGYYSLEVGGVLQQTGIYTVASTGLTINLTAGNTNTYSIPTSTPITLAVTEPSITT